jgi:hypothetical protein
MGYIVEDTVDPVKAPLGRSIGVEAEQADHSVDVEEKDRRVTRPLLGGRSTFRLKGCGAY